MLSGSGVEALVQGYKLFDFASGRPSTRRSPFWRYFRQTKEKVQESGHTVSILFTNTIRCSAASDAGHTLWSVSEDDRTKFLAWQKGLLKAEIAALNPTMVIFVTGHGYDKYIESEFANTEYLSVGDYEKYILARIESVDLPVATYRTYHPGYLNRGIGFAPIGEAIRDALQRR